MSNNFWQVNIGNILTIVSILLVLYGFHITNRSKIEEGIKEFTQFISQLTELQGDFKEMKSWMALHAPMMAELKAKMDIIYKIWFEGHDSRGKGGS